MCSIWRGDKIHWEVFIAQQHSSSFIRFASFLPYKGREAREFFLCIFELKPRINKILSPFVTMKTVIDCKTEIIIGGYPKLFDSLIQNQKMNVHSIGLKYVLICLKTQSPYF